MAATHSPSESSVDRVKSDVPFYLCFGVIGATYIVLTVAMLVSTSLHTSPDSLLEALNTKEVRYSIRLSLISCAVTTILALWVAVPIGYLMSRHNFFGKAIIDAILDIPIVLPPLVIGLCLLILFNTGLAQWIASFLYMIDGLLQNHRHWLVPAVVGLSVSLAAVIGYLSTERLLKSRRTRGLIWLAVTIVITSAAATPWLFPSVPEWIPIPSSWERVDAVRMDQSPLVKSREVLSAKYVAVGDRHQIVSDLKSQINATGFGPPEERLIPASTSNGQSNSSTTPESQWRITVPFEQTEDGSIPYSGHLEYILTRQSHDGDQSNWHVEMSLYRSAKESQPSFAPKITFDVVYAVPSVILAQFMVACAFAVRTMRVTFDQIHPRFERVALTLGCTRAQAFWRVIFPQSLRGLLAAATLAWARSLGEFGPILIFSGTTRMKTEVLPSTVFLELTTGNIEGAVAASLILVSCAVIVLVIARVFGLKRVGI